ncbi:hypothetical protein SSX86_018542 [Deinandra increscens subsp. villosa]|uniref:Transcription repressor n=1 Tax=Deinandra increscens subsp. villosa TaxID=3103831 RepID=A0AAP0CQW8_9ASTR
MSLIPSFFLHKQIWLWPSSCNHHPKTLSFRATHHKDKDTLELMTTLGSLFTDSSESPSVSTDDSDSSAVETIVRGARSERLFFQPDSTSSILETQGSGSTSSENGGGGGGGGEDGGGLPYKECVAVVVETGNPYGEFKESMEEMMESHCLKDWDCLEELLGWYLRMNEKDNHEIIVGAFFDLLAGISSGGGGGGGGGGGDGGVSCVDRSGASLTSASSDCSSPISSCNGN